LGQRGIHDLELFHKNYIIHNDKLWERYRKGFIKQDELRVKRMMLCLMDFKVANEELAKEMSDLFLQLLPTRTSLFPDTIEVLQYLSDKGYQLHLITNGFEEVQHCKLRNSGLDRFFNEVITSEGSQSLKPNREIFDYAMQRAGAEAEESIMLGDSLDVDIAGAMNVGMDQVHVNYLGVEQHIKPTYSISQLIELKEIL
jgi:putative hydrolase of the HAD superfamily